MPTVYLMRGLPGSGKSTTARKLAGELGTVLETDQYFYTDDGQGAKAYRFDESRLPQARQWLFENFCEAIREGVSPIVVDRGNGLNPETRQFALYAVERGYEVRLAEPDSPWWQELRVLLKYKKFVADELLDHWAQLLADKTRNDHRVPVATIRRWMHHWRHDLTVAQILDYEPERS